MSNTEPVLIEVEGERSSEELTLPPNETIRGTAIHLEFEWVAGRLESLKQQYVDGGLSEDELESKLAEHFGGEETILVEVREGGGETRHYSLTAGESVACHPFNVDLRWVGGDSIGGLKRQYVGDDLDEGEFETKLADLLERDDD